MPAPTENNFFIHTTHSPHTEPDPRIDSPPPDYTRILTSTNTQDSHAPISPDGQYIPTLSPPHSPHTQPDPRVLNPPIFSLQVPTIFALLDFPLDSLPPNNPHTAPVHFISSNSNPQSGEAQLDFIPSSNPNPQSREAQLNCVLSSKPNPRLREAQDFIPSSNPNPQSREAQFNFLPSSKPNPWLREAQVNFTLSPISNPSTPFEPSLMIPYADDDIKYQEQNLDRRNSCSTLTSTIPEASNDTKYEMKDSTDHCRLSPSSSTTTLVLSVISHPGTLAPQGGEKKANAKKAIFFKGSDIDTELGNYEMNPSTADRGTFIRRRRCQRIKILWFAFFVALAIVFGVLGATVWKSDHDTSPSDKNENKSIPSPTNNTNNNNNGSSTIAAP
ncbi:hypothetical protein BGZ93_009947 [Podila epicladia]|nr:hypothetical protein BGZ92_001769 [Podila epicladia]KAG0089245.1 hypothetical protein BGZ93_009947 [Podila epicladia]